MFQQMSRCGYLCCVGLSPSTSYDSRFGTGRERKFAKSAFSWPETPFRPARLPFAELVGLRSAADGFSGGCFDSVRLRFVFGLRLEFQAEADREGRFFGEQQLAKRLVTSL